MPQDQGLSLQTPPAEELPAGISAKTLPPPVWTLLEEESAPSFTIPARSPRSPGRAASPADVLSLPLAPSEAQPCSSGKYPVICRQITPPGAPQRVPANRLLFLCLGLYHRDKTDCRLADNTRSRAFWGCLQKVTLSEHTPFQHLLLPFLQPPTSDKSSHNPGTLKPPHFQPRSPRCWASSGSSREAPLASAVNELHCSPRPVPLKQVPANNLLKQVPANNLLQTISAGISEPRAKCSALSCAPGPAVPSKRPLGEATP